ncbi:MAG: DUF4301 family protein [Candidatus Eisenbacteria bacterium]
MKPAGAPHSPFTPPDLEELAAHGISANEAGRQLDLLAHPPAPLVLDRPCGVGDGIVTIGAAEGGDLLKLHAEVADRGRVSVFVPASGAATRMFRQLLTVRADASLGSPEGLEAAASSGHAEARATREFLAGLDRFAFFAELKAAAERGGVPLRSLVRTGPITPILAALLDDSGLGYAALPKGLLAFHDYPDGSRTPFDEHLVEATRFAADGGHRCRLHFTVSPEHRALFEARLAAVAPRIEERLGASFEVGFSVQKPSTDTIAATPEGAPIRIGGGRLLLRPAGHGALIENLADLGADLVLIRNIDNVAHDRFKRDTFTWSRLLLGLAARLERTASSLWRSLEGGGDEKVVADATQFLTATFRRSASFAASAPRSERAAWARAQLARPVRVCGMVPNTGEPGGGPMWVRGPGGETTPQVVELSEVSADDPGQQAVAGAATHFNPVFMALALRDAGNRPYRLADFVDQSAVIIVKKSAEGRDLLALERPGLWNGAMAGWNTVFVEVPITVFNPVKTVNDLLRKEHQAG